MKRLVAGLPLFFTAAILFAQVDPTATPRQLSDKAAAGLLVGVIGCWLIGALFWLAVWLGIAIWVTKDASRRQSPNATLVTVLAWIPATTVIGLIIHLITRPKTTPNP